MQTLGLDEEIEFDASPRPAPPIEDDAYTGFWKRQFLGQATNKQKTYDWVFGVVMPVVCFAFDPIIFKGGGLGPLMGQIKPFAYILSYTSIMAMVAWLLFGARLKWLNGILAGLFAAGGAISLLIGIFLLPFSLIGLLFLIGALGFTPLFTSLIYLRNAVRAYRAAGPFIERRALIPGFLLAALYSVVVPAVINIEIGKYINGIRFGNAASVRAATAKLRYVSFLIDATPIARSYYSFENRAEREAIGDAYEVLSGESINSRHFYD